MKQQTSRCCPPALTASDAIAISEEQQKQQSMDFARLCVSIDEAFDLQQQDFKLCLLNSYDRMQYESLQIIKKEAEKGNRSSTEVWYNAEIYINIADNQVISAGPPPATQYDVYCKVASYLRQLGYVVTMYVNIQTQEPAPISGQPCIRKRYVYIMKVEW